MKGVILAGGTGTRLRELTKVINKHLLPVYNEPMIYYPIRTLINAGIRSTLIVTDKRKAGDFLRLLGSGEEFGARFTYGLQDKAKGIADALLRAKDFVGDDKMTVILGDNIVLGQSAWLNDGFKGSCKLFLKEVSDPSRYGVAVLSGEGKLVDIVEKPSDPPSNLIVTGIYQYSSEVFDIIENLTPSGRGELEITDVNRELLGRGKVEYEIIDNHWIDAGTVESLYEAQEMVRKFLKDGEEKT